MVQIACDHLQDLQECSQVNMQYEKEFHPLPIRVKFDQCRRETFSPNKKIKHFSFLFQIIGFCFPYCISEGADRFYFLTKLIMKDVENTIINLVRTKTDINKGFTVNSDHFDIKINDLENQIEGGLEILEGMKVRCCLKRVICWWRGNSKPNNFISLKILKEKLAMTSCKTLSSNVWIL